jgi:hypothetical protein
MSAIFAGGHMNKLFFLFFLLATGIAHSGNQIDKNQTGRILSISKRSTDQRIKLGDLLPPKIIRKLPVRWSWTNVDDSWNAEPVPGAYHLQNSKLVSVHLEVNDQKRGMIGLVFQTLTPSGRESCTLGGYGATHIGILL